MKREALARNGGTHAGGHPAAGAAGQADRGAADPNEPTVEMAGQIAQPAQAPQQTITIEEINGRLSELSDINQILTARCATMRGDMAKKDMEIARLTKELVAARQQLEAKPNLLKKGGK